MLWVEESRFAAFEGEHKDLSKWIVYVLGAFFVLGGVDYLIGNRLKLGEVFLETLKKMGVVCLGVLGIYSLAPAAAGIVERGVGPLAQALHMEPSIFPCMLFPIDMGGYNLGVGIMQDEALGMYAAIVISAICGAGIGYTIPVSVTMIDKRHFPQLSLGLLSGVACIPIGCLVGSFLAGLPFLNTLWNLLPMTLLALLLVLGLWKKPGMMVKVFVVFGRILSGISCVGLLLQGVKMIFGWEPIPGMAPLGEALTIVCRIIFTMCGGMCLMAVLRRCFKGFMRAFGRRLRIGDAAVAGMLASTVSVVIPFSDMDNLDKRGQVLVCAYAAGGAYVLGGQLGLASELAPELIPAFVVAKLVAGICGVCLAWLLLKNRKDIPDYRPEEKEESAHASN